MFCSCSPEMYEPHMYAFSPHVSRGYADQQNSQPVPPEKVWSMSSATPRTRLVRGRIPIGSVTKRLLSSHSSEGARERIVTWHWWRVVRIGLTSWRREQDQRSAQAPPFAPMLMLVHIPATACHALRCPHLLMATRGTQYHLSLCLARIGARARDAQQPFCYASRRAYR